MTNKFEPKWPSFLSLSGWIDFDDRSQHCHLFRCKNLVIDLEEIKHKLARRSCCVHQAAAQRLSKVNAFAFIQPMDKR